MIPGLGRSLEKEMTTPSNILALEIPWTEEPGRLQFMGVARVGCDLMTKPPPHTEKMFGPGFEPKSDQ